MDMEGFLKEKIKLLTLWLRSLLTIDVIVASGIITFYISNLNDISLVEKQFLIAGVVIVIVITIIIILINKKINHFINLLKQ